MKTFELLISGTYHMTLEMDAVKVEVIPRKNVRFEVKPDNPILIMHIKGREAPRVFTFDSQPDIFKLNGATISSNTDAISEIMDQLS